MDTYQAATEKTLTEIERLDRLLVLLSRCHSFADKIALLDQIPSSPYPPSHDLLSKFLAKKRLGIEEYVVKAVSVIGQGHLLSIPPKSSDQFSNNFYVLIKDLLNIELFYQAIGGVIGYQRSVLNMLSDQENNKEKGSFDLYSPKAIDLSRKNLEVKKGVIEGVRRQDTMVEFYPIGGVADRLQLKDIKTRKALPAARLIFLGKSLLKLMMNDLQAREYLHFKLFGKQVLTPIIMMTSNANNNDQHIAEICEKNEWFGREKELFKLLPQPSVPTFTKKGVWCLKNPMALLLKPGGHGVIWTLADQSGVFQWLKNLGKQKILVRQINNPMAGIDDGLLAFLGVGHLKNKDFGFACCPRLVNAKEGMNVLKVEKASEGLCLTLTNIEYCEFEKFGLGELPHKGQGRYSDFPSNTNTLFADLDAVSKIVKKMPFPGLLVNFREEKHFKEGEVIQEKIARLESTMQNLADGFTISGIDSLTEKTLENLPTYITFNKRRKTISATKKQDVKGDSILETPYGCYFDFLKNMKELLESYCQVKIPKISDKAVFLEKGFPFFFHYHPALGPVFSVIGQKIFGGEIHKRSQLELEIADIEMRNLNLQGSLFISSDAIMGSKDVKGNLVYSHLTGQCQLINVSVKNRGFLPEEKLLPCSQEESKEAGLKIVLSGHSRFVAENVTFFGEQTIKVPDGMCVRAFEKKGSVIFEKIPLKGVSPFWSYKVDSDYNIKISRAKD